MNLRRDVFQAIADPTRRAILLLLTSQSLTAGAIASNFDTARPTVSKHLQILTECELLKQEYQGREIYYHFNPNKKQKSMQKTANRKYLSQENLICLWNYFLRLMKYQNFLSSGWERKC